MKSNHKSPYIAWLHSYKMFRIGKFIETESWLVVEGKWGKTDNRYEVSFLGDENILMLDFGNGYTPYECT